MASNVSVSNVIPFPSRPQPDREVVDAVNTAPEDVYRLSEEFLRQAARMHGSGESGADIYMALILALCTLVCRDEDDPSVIEQKLAASYAHMREAQHLLVEGWAR